MSAGPIDVEPELADLITVPATSTMPTLVKNPVSGSVVASRWACIRVKPMLST